MANKLTYQVLKDSNQEAIIKITGVLDGNTELNVVRIQANTLGGAIALGNYPAYLVANTTLQFANTPLSYYDLQIKDIKYSVSGNGYVELFWTGIGSTDALRYANSVTAATLSGVGSYGLTEQSPSIYNNANNLTSNGDIGIATVGMGANSSYTIVIGLRKNNAYYDRGFQRDPAAFNYGLYALPQIQLRTT